MKTLFLGGLAARVAPRIIGKMREKLDDPVILADLNDMQRMIPALAEAEIVVGHIWRPDFPAGAAAQAAAGGDRRDRHDRRAVVAARHHGLQRLRPRAGDRRIRADDDAGADPPAARHRDRVPRRLLGVAPAGRRLAARRDPRQDARHRRLRPDRPRGREARRELRLHDHRRQPQPGRPRRATRRKSIRSPNSTACCRDATCC